MRVGETEWTKLLQFHLEITDIFQQILFFRGMSEPLHFYFWKYFASEEKEYKNYYFFQNALAQSKFCLIFLFVCFSFTLDFFFH